MKKMIQLTRLVGFLAVMGFIFAYPAAAEQEDMSSHSDGGSISLGFHWYDADILHRSAPYEDDEEFTPVLEVDFANYPLPHRYTLRGEYFGSNDYYGEFNYSYSDIFMVRNLLRGVHHNLDHYNYDFHGDPPSVTYADRNMGDEYHLDFLKNDLYLRAKAPNYPFHTFLKHNYVSRKGSIQERFLIGYFGSIDKTSETREIDWQANDLTIGVNSHLGPVEAEYAYNMFEFDPGNNAVLYDFYRSGRPPDTYPHNVIAETESYGNTLKLHTTYTGQIVASATLSNEERTNNYSGAEADAWKGAFDFQWALDPTLSLFFRYRHLTMDKENPESTVLVGARSRVSYKVRKPVSYDKDLIAIFARYRPLSNLTVNGSYEFEKIERDEIDEWILLPESTDVHRVKLTARAKLMPTLKLKGTYQYQHYVDPAYNKNPDHFNKLMVNASYVPNEKIVALFDYSLTLTQRDDLLYHNGSDLVEGGERDGQTDRLLASVTYLLTSKTSLTASWAYNRWKTEQDTAYSQWDAARPGSTTTVPYYDYGAQYTDDVHTFALTLHTKLRRDLKLNAGLSYLMAESEYEPNPSYLTVFTSKESTETVAKIELMQQVTENWEVGLKCKAGLYDDDYNNSAFDQDDEFYSTTLILKRYF